MTSAASPGSNVAARVRALIAQAEGVFRGQFPRCVKVGEQAKRAPAGSLCDELHSCFKQRCVASKFIDDKARDQRRVVCVDHGLAADELRDHAAAIDIANENDRGLGGARKSHIGDVMRAQIDLGGAAGAFNDDKIICGFQTREAVHHHRRQPGFPRLIVAGFRLTGDLPAHNDLRAILALRL